MATMNSWQDLLDYYKRVATAQFASTPDRNEAMALMIENVVYAMLEKLRDEHGEC